MNLAMPLTRASTKTPQMRIEAFVTSEAAKLAVERITETLGQGAALSLHSGTLATAVRIAGMTSFGDILIAEIGAEPEEATLDLIRELDGEGVHLVLLGQRDDVRSYRNFTAAGAKDYLVLPLDPVAGLHLNLPGAVAPEVSGTTRAKSIAVCGVTGGVGASALAQNLAAAYLELARAGKLDRDSAGKLALVDADLEFGSLAVDLEFAATTGFLDALQVPDRVDETFLTSTMAEPVQGLYAYSTEIGDSTKGPAYRAGLPRLLRRLRVDFPTVIVDLPRAVLFEQPALVAEFDEIVLVMGPGFSAVRCASRIMDRIGADRSGMRCTLVLSHTRRDAGLKKAEIATNLDVPVVVELPRCGAELERAHVKGQPLCQLAPRSAYSRSVVQLAAHLEARPQAHGAAAPSQGRFWRKGWFGS